MLTPEELGGNLLRQALLVVHPRLSPTSLPPSNRNGFGFRHPHPLSSIRVLQGMLMPIPAPGGESGLSMSQLWQNHSTWQSFI